MCGGEKLAIIDKKVEVEENGKLVTRNITLTGKPSTTLKKRHYRGRKKIETYKELNDDTVEEILAEAFQTHMSNVREIEYLENYYLGDQPILDRIKDVRPNIKNDIVENHAYEIVEFKIGHTFGEPVQFVQKSSLTEDEDGETNEVKAVDELNDALRMQSKDTIDRELAEHMFITGTGYKMVLPEDGDYLIDVIDPKKAFVVYSNAFGRKPLLGVTFNYIGNNEYKVYAYGEKRIWKFTVSNNFTEFKSRKSRKGAIGQIPLIEYPLNPKRQGSFEVVLELLDAINIVSSNRVDGIEQFVQALVVLNNVELDSEQYDEMLSRGALMVKSTDGDNRASVDILSAELNQTQTQTLIDYMYQTVLTITGVPDRRASSGGDTGQATSLGQGWTNAESRAIATENMFKRSERAFLKVLLSIAHKYNKHKDLKMEMIDIKFSRNMSNNLLIKTQSLANMVSTGVHPRHALSISGLVSDPESIYQDSKEYFDSNRENKENKDIAVPAGVDKNIDKGEDNKNKPVDKTTKKNEGDDK